MIVEAAIQEDVDAVGVSLLSGAHMTIFPAVAKLMEEKGCDDMLLIGGGIIPDDEIKQLEQQGIDKLFGPGTPTEKIIEFIKTEVPRRRKSEEIM
jgi:methylmalonyl-CoA mutase C-terminal domain/subunit